MSKLTIRNPADDSVIDEVEADDGAAVLAKYGRARKAQGGWARTPFAERRAAIEKFGRLMAERTDELAAITTREVGKPIAQAKNELRALQGRIDFFLQEAEKTVADETVSRDDKMTEIIAHEPLGVVANISAWNYPYFVGANVFVPALLTGNAVLYKPSEFATHTGLGIARALHDAGVPTDVFVPVVGDGSTGSSLVDRDVDGIFFTGSYATGVRIAAAARAKLIPVQLELGGKDPAYVAEDVDVAAAAASTADGAFYNTGQSCCSVERIYVHERVHDAFVEAFLAEVKGFVIGDPTDEKTYIGPLTRGPQITLLEQQIQDAKEKGGKVLAGGARLDRPGHWFAPTVIGGATNEMALMREESFGPVIGIAKVSSDEDALEKMNDTRYGLTAGVYTRDEARARRLLAQVNAGSAYWNCCDRVSPRLPWSGRGDSGLGVTLSRQGILAFTRPKALHLRAP